MKIIERSLRAIVYRAEHPDGPWEPVKPEDVPEWVKEQEVLGRLLQGMMAMDKEGEIFTGSNNEPFEYGSEWYRAEELPALH